MDYTTVLMMIGAFVFLAGAGLLVAARKADQENYIVEKATPMDLSLVNARDDVWLRGTAVCNRPLRAPHFKFSCIHYEYELEEKVEETTTDDQGRTKTETRWVTRERRKESAPFGLRQGDLYIEIASDSADYRYLEKKVARAGRWRHTVYYLPFPSDISAVGSVSDDKNMLEPYMGIPLIVTTLERDEFVKKVERGESLMRFFGFLSLWAGVGTFLYGSFDRMSWPYQTGGRFHTETLVASAAFAMVPALVVWSIYMYNTFVQYRHRIENAWRNIDPDLRMRYDLIPNLVAAVKGYMQHEKKLLEEVAAIRSKAAAGDISERIRSEAELTGSTARLLAVIENYPDLKSNELVSRLMRELKALEEKIAHSREFYNQTVKEYNDNVMAFPRGLLAKLFGFKRHDYFELV